MIDGKVRGAINRLIVADGYAPSVQRIARELGVTAEDVEAALTRLAADRSLVLHPGTSRIWVAHPFSLAPTGFWVQTAAGSWWGNCAWCALGIAAMLDSDAVITTRLGGENQDARILVESGQVAPQELLAHFAVPARQWWDNVIYTCSTILLFDNHTAIEDWCDRHDVTGGETLQLPQLWELAQAWYGDYLAEDWQRHTAGGATGILSRLGLSGSFWDLRPSRDD